MKLAHNSILALKLGAKILPSEIADYGVTTLGNVYWVDADNGADTDDGLTAQTAFKTIAKAYATVVSDHNDVIILSATATPHAQTSMLTIAKNRVHFVGADLRNGAYGMGARARITMGVTTATTDVAVLLNTGTGNTFSNIKFASDNTLTQSLYTVVDSGEYAIYNNCEFYKSTMLDVSLAAEVLANGDSTQWVDCVFGSDANAVATACIRPNVLCTRGTAPSGTGQLRDNIFSHCLFLVLAGATATATRRVYGANANDVERMLLFENCVFLASAASLATPGAAVGFGAAQNVGTVLLKACTSVAHTLMVAASVGIYVDGAVPTFATTGVAKSS